MNVKVMKLDKRVDNAEFVDKSDKDTLETLTKENEKIKESLTYMKSQSMRNNLIFSNITEKANEKPEDTEEIIRNFMKKELKVDESVVKDIACSSYGTEYAVYPNTEFNVSYTDEPVNSLNDCMMQCSVLPECRGFTYADVFGPACRIKLDSPLTMPSKIYSFQDMSKQGQGQGCPCDSGLSYSGTGDKSDLDNHSKQCNPNNPLFQGHDSGYSGKADKADLDNHSDQLNPNNDKFQAKK
ncbi:hypothetical protein ACF0H5_000831 [Mactra antiquata]